MKILQVNCVYKKGSTGKIVYDLHSELLNNNVDSIVCYGRGDNIEEEKVYKTGYELISKFNNLKSRFTGMPYNGAFFSTKKLIHIIEKEKPDLIHLHCINGFFVNIYALFNYLKSKELKTVLTLHAEFMYTGGCGYALDCDQWKDECKKCPQLKEATNSLWLDRTSLGWRKMYDSFNEFKNLVIISVSPWLEERAKASKILHNKKHMVILNGIDTINTFFPNIDLNLRNRLSLKDEKVILHVTASFSSEMKGGKYIIELAKQMKEIKFIVIGNTKKMENLPDNIIDIGRIDNQKILAHYYSLADLTVLTSKKETFSMVCAESLACGTKVVGFKAGAPEKIALKEYSEFCEYGNIPLLKKIINKNLSIPYNKKEVAKIAGVFYSKEKMYENYMRVYEEMIND